MYIFGNLKCCKSLKRDLSQRKMFQQFRHRRRPAIQLFLKFLLLSCKLISVRQRGSKVITLNIRIRQCISNTREIVVRSRITFVPCFQLFSTLPRHVSYVRYDVVILFSYYIRVPATWETDKPVGDVHFDSGYDNIFIMHVSSCKKLFLAFYINNYNIKTFWCKKTPTCNERCVMSRHNINDICDFQIQFLTLNNYFNDKQFYLTLIIAIKTWILS